MYSWMRYVGMVLAGLLLCSGCYVATDLPHPSQLKCPDPTNPLCPGPRPSDGGVSDRVSRPPVTRSCGNGRCEPTLGESCLNCAPDCGCQSGQLCLGGTCTFCGNGKCEASRGETCASCFADCGCQVGFLCTKGACSRAMQCGDGRCDAPQETCVNCPTDCPCAQGQSCRNGRCEVEPFCGDGTCEAGRNENCVTCPQDCGCQSGQGCRGGNCYPCACQPGQKRCFADSVQLCSASCLEWQTLDVCSGPENLICNPTTFQCECNSANLCTAAGAARCGTGGVREVCYKGQRCSYWKTDPCQPIRAGEPVYCTKGKCCECRGNEAICIDDDHAILECDGCYWYKPYYCPYPTYCYKGDCEF